MVQPDQNRNPVDRLAAELRRMQQRIEALERGGLKVPILDDDPSADDPTNLWMFNDGRLRGRDAEARVREWGPAAGFALNLTGGWPTAAPGPTDGTAFTLPFGGVLRGMVACTAWTPTAVNLTVDPYIDGTLVGATMRLNQTFPTSTHLALAPRTFEVTLAAGTHYMYFRQTSGTSDSGDFGSAWGVLTAATPGASTSGDPKPAVSLPHLHQTTWAATDSQCFCPVHGLEDPLYFGQLDAVHGERRLMFLLPSSAIQTELSGATIQQVEINARTLDAYQPQVEIAWGGHVETVMPGTYKQQYEDVWRDTWPQVGGGTWRTMPRWFGKALRDGDITGLVVNQPSTSKAFYGRLDPDLSIRVTYTHAH